MSQSQSLYVARGRTVMIDGEPNGPGSAVSLPANEAAFLQKRGFLQAEPPILTPPPAVPNPANVGLQTPGGNVQGHVYRR
jgi:hypothetical protein